MGSEIGKTEDRDRVSLEGEMKGNEAKKIPKKFQEVDLYVGFKVHVKFGEMDVRKVIKLGKDRDFLVFQIVGN